MSERPELPEAIRTLLPPVAQAYLTALEAALAEAVAALAALSPQVTTLQARVAALEALLSHALLDLDTRSSHHASNYPIETPQLAHFPCVSRVDLTKTGDARSRTRWSAVRP